MTTERSIIPSFNVYLDTGIIPDFPEKGLYRQWDKQWNPVGYGPEPHHKGQIETRFPPEWAPSMCFIAAHYERTMTHD